MKKDILLQVRIDKRTDKRLTEIAEQVGESRAEVVRQLINGDPVSLTSIVNQLEELVSNLRITMARTNERESEKV
jgi:predicted transcriptional regulator